MNTINQGASSGALLQLAERVEAAMGPDEALDIDIVKAVGWSEHRGWKREDGWRIPLPFTASIDAAMTLVPEGWWVQHLGQCLTGWRARVERNVGRDTESIGVGFGMADPAKTLALALCAAALKARAAQGDGPCR